MADTPVMFVTGARKGIGRYLVEHYLAAGYRVAGCSRKPADDMPPGYHHFALDVGDERAVTAAFHELRRDFGRLDVLVNNAGIASMNHMLLTTAAMAERMLRTNVVGAFLLAREAVRLMKLSGGGRIVNLSSVAVPLRVDGEALYAASKAAVETLTRIWARELAAMKITVNAVGPTPIRTDLIRGVAPEKIEALVRRQAIQRLGEPRDVANVIDFFLRAESDFITGQIVYLGGV